MIRIEKTTVSGWESTVRGMRNPLNSWEKSDSNYCYDSRFNGEGSCERICCKNCVTPFYNIGSNDFNLMRSLISAGTDHRKFLRMIIVYADITSPFYWWKEFDTYKVGTVANSCSTMHKIHAKEFTESDFSCENMDECGMNLLNIVINYLNSVREMYNINHDRIYWDDMIKILPMAYNQKRTVMLNYEVLRNIYHSRKNHKLIEWRDFCTWIEGLPYSELITDKG